MADKTKEQLLAEILKDQGSDLDALQTLLGAVFVAVSLADPKLSRMLRSTLDAILESPEVFTFSDRSRAVMERFKKSLDASA